MEGGDYTGSESQSAADVRHRGESVDGFRGTCVLVTGGAHRVGAEIARHLARRGARVAVHYHGSAAAALELTDELAHGARAFRADLSTPDGPGALLAACEQDGMSPDAVVHAAASFLRRPLATTTAEEWDGVMALNLRALFLLARDYGSLRGGRGGQIVAIADSGARELWPGYLAHCVSKAGVLTLVQALAKAMAPKFRVNAVVPGPVLLPEGVSSAEREAIRGRTLLGRLGEPRHVAEAVEFLLACDYATGAILDITGGAHLWRSEKG